MATASLPTQKMNSFEKFELHYQKVYNSKCYNHTTMTKMIIYNLHVLNICIILVVPTRTFSPTPLLPPPSPHSPSSSPELSSTVGLSIIFSKLLSPHFTVISIVKLFSWWNTIKKIVQQLSSVWKGIKCIICTQQASMHNSIPCAEFAGRFMQIIPM